MGLIRRAANRLGGVFQEAGKWLQQASGVENAPEAEPEIETEADYGVVMSAEGHRMVEEGRPRPTLKIVPTSGPAAGSANDRVRRSRAARW